MKRFLTLSIALLLASCTGAGAGLNAGGGAGTVPSMGAPALSSSHISPSRMSPAALHALMADRAARPANAIVGSSNTVTADMPVPRPDTTPCTVTLFDNYVFKNFNNQTFNYTPPASCKGPWAKVVFNFDVSVTKGTQYDRTATIWLDGAPIYFGTTAEPDSTLAPSWHVERDVTELSALFTQASQGQIALYNCYCLPTYNAYQEGKAYVQFYPPDAKYPAPKVPDEVIGLPYSPPLGNLTTIKYADTMSITKTFPKNVTSAYLDVYLQSQSDEEQWFMCVPTDVWTQSGNELGFCQYTALREGDVSLDGTPAGTAPIFPWIYTGGLDPDLWSPLPGVQTLNFKPFRVDLTPFASTLSDGSSHTISVGVANAYSYFSGTGDLLIYRDPGATTVTGKLESNSLSARPPISIVNTIKYGKGSGLFGQSVASGSVKTTSNRGYTIEGYVNTSYGKVDTTVRVSSTFENDQLFDYTSTGYTQDLNQSTVDKRVTTTVLNGKSTVTTETHTYPLAVRYPISETSTGFQLPLLVYQGYDDDVNVTGEHPSWYREFNTVQSADTMIFDDNFNWINAINGASSQLYTYQGSGQQCYGRELTSKNNVLATDTAPGCSARPSPAPTAFP
jgi:hypothetical protein